MTQIYSQCCLWWKNLTYQEVAVKYTLTVVEKLLPPPLQELCASESTIYTRGDGNMC